MRLEPLEAAKQVITKHFPECQAAVLAGSVTRGEATETSDLDIVVFDDALNFSYRESFIDFGWHVEAFAHNFSSYKYIFQDDIENGVPTMPRLIADGIILKNDDGAGRFEAIKKEAKEIMEAGPGKWAEQTIMNKRYMLTDALDDLRGCKDTAEELFIVNSLADMTNEFYLGVNGQWRGKSKWVIRSLKHFDGEFTARYVEAFDSYYKDRDKTKVIKLVESVMEPYGGPIFSGFSIGKFEAKA